MKNETFLEKGQLTISMDGKCMSFGFGDIKEANLYQHRHTDGFYISVTDVDGNHSRFSGFKSKKKAQKALDKIAVFMAHGYATVIKKGWWEL